MMPRNVMRQSPLHEVEPTSTSRNDCGKKSETCSFQSMFNVTLGNDPCNQSRDKLQEKLPSVTASGLGDRLQVRGKVA